ncbi:MAG: leucine-rich repeat protein [Prevotella sp.]|nr:leucine-rich repeat protein [Prevotella sp.]
MNYPLLSEYIESIKSAEDSFDKLSYLRPVLDDDGLPVMTSGNFAVVFKMIDEQDGKVYAVKCFTKEQEGRAEAYKQITKELKDVESPYLISVRYLDKELFVDTKQTNETEFPVLLMDWVEGKTLDKYLRDNLDDKYALEMLAYRFSKLAQWLIPQPFAHGDLKPDNILVREDGTLVLVDYDGMYVPAMKGQKARELGSPDFRHPIRTEDDFDEHIDDFPLISILLSLKVITHMPSILEEYGAADRLLFSENDYRDIMNSKILKSIFPSEDRKINLIYSILILLLHNSSIGVRENRNYVFLPSFDSCDRAVVYNVFKIKGFNQERPYAKVLFKRFWNSEVEYETVYNLQLIYGKESVDNDGIFNCEAAYDSFVKELKVGSYESINLFDIYLNEISELNNLRDVKTGTIISYIPIATYEDRHHAIEVAKKRVKKNLERKTWESINTCSSNLYSSNKDQIQKDTNVSTGFTIRPNGDFAMVGGAKYSKDLKCLVQCPNIADFSILPGTKTIGERAFCKCRNLVQVTIPDSVEYIGNGAFYWCDKLESVTIDSSVAYIGDSAFSCCKALKKIIIPEHVRYIGASAFANCEALLQVIFLGADITIGSHAFYGCKSLARISIPIWSRRKFETQLPELKSRLIENRF